MTVALVNVSNFCQPRLGEANIFYPSRMKKCFAVGHHGANMIDEVREAAPWRYILVHGYAV
jgi:hypothetical protein